MRVTLLSVGGEPVPPEAVGLAEADVGAAEFEAESAAVVVAESDVVAEAASEEVAEAEFGSAAVGESETELDGALGAGLQTPPWRFARTTPFRGGDVALVDARRARRGRMAESRMVKGQSRPSGLSEER